METKTRQERRRACSSRRLQHIEGSREPIERHRCYMIGVGGSQESVANSLIWKEVITETLILPGRLDINSPYGTKPLLSPTPEVIVHLSTCSHMAYQYSRLDIPRLLLAGFETQPHQPPNGLSRSLRVSVSQIGIVSFSCRPPSLPRKPTRNCHTMRAAKTCFGNASQPRSMLAGRVFP